MGALIRFLIGLGSLAFVIQAGRADEPAFEIEIPAEPAFEAIEQAAPPFEVVMRTAQRLTESDDWRERGWTDPKFEAAVSAIVKRASEVTQRKGFSVPVSLEDVAAPGNEQRRARGVLMVGDAVNVSHAESSIIIGDTGVDVAFANDCLIISRGAVHVSHGARNVILAGKYIDVSHDGNGRPDGPTPWNGSLLVSGDTVDVSHAHDSVICGPGDVRVSHANRVHFINCPPRRRHDNFSQDDDDGSGVFPVAVPPEASPIHDLPITQVVERDERSLVTMLQKGGNEVVIRIGSVVPSDDPRFEGWRLVFVADGYALFSDGERFAGVRVRR